MSTTAQRSARAALDAARAAVTRLDADRGSEDLAADLIDVWSAVEAALRALVVSSALSGQALIREARQLQAINFDQANSLAELQAVHDRLQSTSYRPSAGDVTSARTAFDKLDAALSAEPANTPLSGASPNSVPHAIPIERPLPAVAGPVMNGAFVAAPTTQQRFPVWVLAAIGLGVIALLAVGAYFVFGHRTGDAFQQGVDAYRAGQREVAVNAFNKAARDDPKAVLPHVYLARMAREVGNFTLASQELQLALQTDPANAIALREMGANLFAQANYELARRFYVRAVQADPTDKTAQGYLGCTLVKLGRAAEGANFLNRAGAGPWSACAEPAAKSAA